MPRILVHEECEVFNAFCTCGERVVSLHSDEIDGDDMMMDRKGWLYVLDDRLFMPESTDKDFAVRSRCMECKRLNKYWLQFRFGVLKSWSDITKCRAPSSVPDI